MDEAGWAAAWHLHRLRALISDRVTRSLTLADGARRRARQQASGAVAMYDRAERQFARSMQHVSAEYSALLSVEKRSRAELLQATLDLASSIFPGCHAASITTVLGDDISARRYATVAHTGTAATVDAAQYALEEGPCLEAVAVDHVTVIGTDDLTSNDVPPWPRFRAAAGRLGIKSAISIGVPWTTYWTGPTDPARPPVGAINLYAATPYGFLAKETKAIALGAHLGACLTGVDPSELYDPASLSNPRE